jgi:uridine monophosphate synthetase
VSFSSHVSALLDGFMFHIFPAFKFGEFTLKSGELSPVYFDLRVIVSYPDVMDELTDLMLTFIQEKEIQCDQLCGVPYTGK